MKLSQSWRFICGLFSGYCYAPQKWITELIFPEIMFKHLNSLLLKQSANSILTSIANFYQSYDDKCVKTLKEKLK